MQNFARNSALAKILGLAKMNNFAKIVKFSQSQRNFRNLNEIPGIANSSLLCLLSSTASIPITLPSFFL